MSRSSPLPLTSRPLASAAPRVAHYSARRAVAALLALAGVLAATACGTSSTTITHTATPPPRQHGALYVSVSNQGPAGPTSSTEYALGLSDGKPLWQRQLSGVGSSAAIGGGTLYLGTVQSSNSAPPQGALEALNASTGALLWHRTPSASLESPLAASGDAVFVAEITFANTQAPPTETLQALRAGDGTPLWNAALDGSLGSNATVAGGALYLVTSSATATSTTPPTFTLLALDAGTGKPLWQLALQSPPAGNPAPLLSNGVLYLSEQGAGQGPAPTSLILAVRAGDGTALWHATPPTGGLAGGLVVSGGTVCYSYGLLNGPGGGIVALHATDGSLNWQVATQAGGPVSLVADDGTIYALDTTTTKTTSAASVATTLLAFDASSGKSLLMHPFPGLPVQAEFGTGTQPQVAGGVLFVVGEGVPTQPGPTQPPSVSIAVALGAQDGSLRWDRTLNGNAGSILLATS